MSSLTDSQEDVPQLRERINETIYLPHIISVLEKHGYLMLRKIGVGGFSIAYLVRSHKYREEFVVKVSLNNEYRFDENEITNLTRLAHPNIIRLFDFFKDDKFLYMVLEYCVNGSLEDYIEKNGCFKNYQLFLSTANQLVQALLYCHERGVVHRDLKPANILIDKFGRPKIADFGLSIQMKDKVCHEFSGSKMFMAPEVINRQPHNPMTADVWSLGIIFYIMLKGSHPWGDMANELCLSQMISFGDINLIHLNCPSEIKKIITTMTQKQSIKRATLKWVSSQPIMVESMNNKIMSLLNPNGYGVRELNKIVSLQRQNTMPKPAVNLTKEVKAFIQVNAFLASGTKRRSSISRETFKTPDKELFEL
ncbi:CAMK family protein kinase [Tritrichomonas foetus]|uniref:CAMK family protein kinase n=1 Tax=Tritrichomonas foetus TaxID=1144522 RepID=A0A1J4KH85_9EUKA|nr:CAMK family protein kinase [Tritrichomonas foetus]|eukprot:OHT09196.1 CAMK family protein kinase [Tritrichomonas foetus]